jgi:hypothetical protein
MLSESVAKLSKFVTSRKFIAKFACFLSDLAVEMFEDFVVFDDIETLAICVPEKFYPWTGKGWC